MFSILTLSRLMAIAAITFTTAIITAKAQAQSDPARAVVEGYVAAQHRLDWKTVASYISPADLSDFKKTFQSIFSSIPGPIDTTILRPFSFGKKSSAEIASADSVSYFAGVYSTVFALYPVMRDMATTARDSILGSVNEGDSMKHFVCRVTATAQKENLSNIEVVSVQKIGGKWYVMTKRSMEQMANLMRRAIK